jgi:A/G-specific adenine glycosylase
MKPDTITSFQQTVTSYHTEHGRHDLPWRLPDRDGSFDPYKITVSELMLQQTQVARVIPKYLAFLEAFPTVQALASAPLSEVLTLWSGLGYNRRAKFLWSTAQAVVDMFNGTFPQTKAELVTLAGIGPNTAGAILAYAYNQPVVFIETNIRTVFIHHFFADQTHIPDTALLPLVTDTLPHNEARNWYWALMDYGTHLKQTLGNLSRASAAYAKQSTFQGSRRQIRGQVLRLLTGGAHPATALTAAITDERLASVLEDLTREGLIENNGGLYRLRML